MKTLQDLDNFITGQLTTAVNAVLAYLKSVIAGASGGAGDTSGEIAKLQSIVDQLNAAVPPANPPAA